MSGPEAIERLSHLAQVYRARAGRRRTPDWSAEQKRQDGLNADALDVAVAALNASKGE